MSYHTHDVVRTASYRIKSKHMHDVISNEYHSALYHIMSNHIVSYRITNRVVSYHMTWRYIAACRILMALYHLISYDRRNFGLWKSNFQQYGQMEKQRWDESEKRREVK